MNGTAVKAEDTCVNKNSINCEKTDGTLPNASPLSLLNRLALYHNLKSEFTHETAKNAVQTKVTLKLGAETWTGVGSNLKHARRDAASKALQHTVLDHPPEQKVKTSKANDQALTPTVKLNSIVLKQGKTAEYALVKKNVCQPCYRNSYEVTCEVEEAQVSHMIHTPLHPRPHHATQRGPTYLYHMSVGVDGKVYHGTGTSKQAARHDAAQCALDAIEQVGFTDNANTTPVQTVTHVKSEVSLLYEKAFAHSMSVNFHVVKEEGPAHLKVHTMKVEVGTFCEGEIDDKRPNFAAEGSGTSKKLAKRYAAIAVLKLMENLSSPPVKVKETTWEASQKLPGKPEKTGLHPVSRLIQLMQAQKQREPTFRLTEETGKGRKPTFVCQCKTETETVTGQGCNKKEAKYAAAEAMLDKLGYKRRAPDPDVRPTKSSIKSVSRNDLIANNKPQKVTFSEICSK